MIQERKRKSGGVSNRRALGKKKQKQQQNSNATSAEIYKKRSDEKNRNLHDESRGATTTLTEELRGFRREIQDFNVSETDDCWRSYDVLEERLKLFQSAVFAHQTLRLRIGEPVHGLVSSGLLLRPYTDLAQFLASHMTTDLKIEGSRLGQLHVASSWDENINNQSSSMVVTPPPSNFRHSDKAT